MQYSRRHHQFGLCALVVFLLCALAGKAQVAEDARAGQCPKDSPIRFGSRCLSQCPDGYTLNGDNLCLSKTSADIAEKVCSRPDPTDQKICLSSLIGELGRMKVSDRCVARAPEALILRQEISEMVLTASLQVDGFLAEVDSETAEIRAVHDGLTGRRDKAVQKSTFGSAVASGGGAIGSTLALLGNTASTAGSYLGAVSGGVGAILGFVGFFEQRGPKGCFPDVEETKTRNTQANSSPGGQENPTKDEKKCGKLDKKAKLDCKANLAEYETELYAKDSCKSPPRATGCSPRMLYQLLCPVEAKKAEEALYSESGMDLEAAKTWWFHSLYDPVINNYLNPAEESGRGQELISTWGDNSGLSPALITSNTAPLKLSIANLEDRTNKLADLRAVVARINRDLSRLTEDLAMGLRCPLILTPARQPSEEGPLAEQLTLSSIGW